MISFNNKLPLLIFMALINLSANQLAEAQSREVIIKAGYIEKFTHFVQWPDTVKTNASPDIFVVAIIGETNISKALTDIFQKSKTKNIEIRVVEIKTVDQIKDCRILFICGSEKNNLDKILSYTTGKPILTISDTKGFGEQGVIINMFQEGNYIRYEINRNSLNKSSMIINSLLLNYAIIIGTNG